MSTTEPPYGRPPEPNSPEAARRSSNRQWLIIGGSVIAVIVLIISLLTWFVILPETVESEGENLQQPISRKYTDGQTILNDCTNETVAVANVANAQTDALARIYREAIAGRYGTGDELDRTKLYSALQEAYPDTSGLDRTFDKAVAIMAGCQRNFGVAQREVSKAIEDLTTWQNGSWRVRTFGGDKFPNDNLVVRVAGLPRATGQAALELMEKPIVDTEVKGAYGTGTTTRTNPFDRSTPSPTSS